MARFNDDLNSKFYFSLLAVLILFFCAQLFQPILFSISGIDLKIISSLIVLTFALFGFFNISGVSFGQQFEFVRAIGPFSEPSHYGLALAPWLLLFTITTRSELLKLLTLCIFASIGYLEQSLITLLVVALVGLLTLPWWLLLPTAFSGLIFLAGVDLSYFSDRLMIGEDSTNLSVLVFRQGFAFMISALKLTAWMGLGFQELGAVPLYVPESEVIRALSGEYLNFNDGGFIAAKAISEFGIFGIALCLYATAKGIFVAIKLARLKASTNLGGGLMLAFASCCTFPIELWARGYGYFSSQVLLFIMSLIFIRNYERKMYS